MKRPAKSSKNMTMEKAPTAQLLPFEPTALLDGEDAAAQEELLMRVLDQ